LPGKEFTHLGNFAELLDFVAEVLYNTEMLYATAILKKGKNYAF
jgi:hypothetical protein